MTATDIIERKRVLLLAYSFHPHATMEDRNGWCRALQAAEKYDVHVLCSPSTKLDEVQDSIPESLRPHLTVEPVVVCRLCTLFLSIELLFYLGYRIWLGHVQATAQKRHADRPFHITHVVSLCGYREIGNLWKLSCPSVVGPIGGTSGFRLGFLKILDPCSCLFEVFRNVINWYQLSMSRRVRRSLQNSTQVLAANSSTSLALQTHTNQPIPVMLETGIDYAILSSKEFRDTTQPLKILWAGRLRGWKGLPLLLQAISKLPIDVPVQLRVVGNGKLEKRWRRLATKLGISHKVSWESRPHYRDSLALYRWADVFAFTSLRDTSGTGLLESLAAGTPILGLNHQGAADIITEDSGIKISVHSPEQAIQEFSNAIIKLHREPEYLKRLSDGALERAKNYHWSSYQASTYALYDRLIEGKRPQHQNQKSSDQESSTPSADRSLNKVSKSVLSGTLSLGDQIVVSASSFFTTAIVARTCTQSDVGEFVLAWTVLSFVRTIQERVFAAPFLAFIHRNGYDRPSYRGSCFAHQLLFASLCFVAALLSALIATMLGANRNLLVIIWAMAIAIPLTLIRDQIRAFYTATFEYARVITFDIAVTTIQLGSILALSQTNAFSVAKVVSILGLSCVLPVTIWLIVSRNSLSWSWHQIKVDWSHNWLYAKWLLFARLIGVFPYLAVPWLVAFTISKDAAGAFGNCSSLVGVSLMFVTGVNNMLQPKAVRELQVNGLAGLVACLSETILVIAGTLVAISAAFYFFGGEMLGMVYGEAYASFGMLAFLLSLSTLASSFSTIFGNGLAAFGESKACIWGEGAGCVVSLVIALLAIPTLGLHGASLALILGGTVSSIITGYMLYRSFHQYSTKDNISKFPKIA
jgi:O-antigen/teichoic acid export membrane protein/glycosyltransferase involved in cell wall biosynthesis